MFKKVKIHFINPIYSTFVDTQFPITLFTNNMCCKNLYLRKINNKTHFIFISIKML